MSALQFLNKKSWHVSTIKNNEKVWIKEQEAAKEAKRIEQLQKQLDEERKLEEIQRLEAATGRLSEAEILKSRRLNWMYEGPSEKRTDKEKEEEQEKVLLGQKEADLEKEEIDNSVALIDAESKLREDPLFSMKLKSQPKVPAASRKRAGVVRKEEVRPSRNIEDQKRKREKEAKRARKEERRRIREERQQRRDDRRQRNSSRYLYEGEIDQRNADDDYSSKLEDTK